MKEVILKYHSAIIWSLLIFQLLLFVINIPGLKIDIDEPWFGEQAYYLAENGIVKSEMFRDFLRYDERILVYHKVFIWAGALTIKSLGFNLYSLRLISLLSGILLAGLLYGFCKKYYNITVFRITLLILLFCPLIFRNTIIYRPEIMICAFGFLSFFFLYEFMQNKRLLFLILSAATAGFTLLIHLNGIIFIGAGAILLLSEKRWGHFAIYSAIATIVASLYFYEALGNMELFSLQFTQDPSNAGGNIEWYMPFKNLINEHKRLFRKPEIIGITILFLLSAFYWIKNSFKEKRHILIYTFCLIILLGAINHNKTTKYAILLLPYFSLIIAEYIHIQITHREKTKSFLQKIFLFLLCLTVSFGIYTSGKSILFDKGNMVRDHHAVVSSIPIGSKLLAPIRFSFNEIGNYDIFGLLPAKIILDNRGEDFNAENVCQIAAEYEVEYIIIDDEYRQQLGCTLNDTTCLEYEQYKYFKSQKKFDIYKRASLLIE